MKHLIDPDVLAQIVKTVVAESAAQNLTNEQSIELVREKIADAYPDFVSKTPRCWMGSRAGGILGKMTLLHASMNEYLIIFGCPVSSAGFSGRYNFVEIWDFFLTGQTRTCDLENGQINPNIYKAGDVGFLAKGQSLSCDFTAETWMVEYGRGWIVTALPFALMDSLLSSVELKSFYLTVKEYTYFILKRWFYK